MTKKMNQFLRHCIIGDWIFPGSTSVQVLFPIGTVLDEEPASSLLCGFAFAFDRHAKSFASNFSAYSSSWTSGISCSLLFNSSQTCLIHEKFWPRSENCLFSQTYFWSQLRTYHASNRLQFPTRAQFWCSLGSTLLVVMLLHLLAECIHDKPLHEIVRIMQCLSSWNTVHSQQHSGILHPYKIYSILSCCDNFSIRSP